MDIEMLRHIMFHSTDKTVEPGKVKLKMPEILKVKPKQKQEKTKAKPVIKMEF